MKMKWYERFGIYTVALCFVGLTMATAAECGAEAQEDERRAAAKVYIQCVDQYSFRATCTDCSWPAWTWEDVEARCQEVSGFTLSAVTPTDVGEYREEISELKSVLSHTIWERERAEEGNAGLEAELHACELKAGECKTDLNLCCP